MISNIVLEVNMFRGEISNQREVRGEVSGAC
jgi:hypothetical protein